jgi:hypothetical protein
MSKTDQPDRNLDDSWALSASMPVPRLGSVDGSSDEGITVPSPSDDSARGDTVHDGHPAAVAELLGQPAPPRIPAAAPSGPGTGHEAAASVVARAAALRALGAKTMQGFGPAPINKARSSPPGASMAPVSPSQLQEEATAFDPSSAAAAFEAATVADGHPRPALDTPPPMQAMAPMSSETPAEAPSEAPLYLDDPPHLLRLSTNTSDHAVAPIDPGVSASMPLDSQLAYSGADSGVGDSLDASYDGDSGRSGYSGEQPYQDEEDEEPDDPSSYTEEQANYSGEQAGYQAAYSGERAAYGSTEGSYSGEHVHDSAEYRHAAPEAPPAVQLVAPGSLPRRPYTTGSSESGRAESDWFEPSSAQPMSDPSNVEPIDHSFTQPSRRSRPPVPNRWIAPVAVFIAVSAVVFAGGYFYYRSQPAPIVAAPPAGEPPRAAAGDLAGAAGGSATPPAGDGAAGAAGAAGTASGSAATGEPPAPAGGVPAGLIDVRFDSNPPGAAVMLVDRGRGVTTPVGTTPVRTALDPKAAYDAIFTLEGHPTKVISLEASKVPQRVLAELTGAPAGEARPAEQVAAADPGKGAEPAGDAAAKASEADDGRSTNRKRPRGRDKEREKPSDRAAKEREQEREESAEPAGVDVAAMGSLTISAKPPCEISINGKATGRMTPVRELPVTAGIHKITLINKSIGVNETIAVRVTAGKETKVTQDYTGTP